MSGCNHKTMRSPRLACLFAFAGLFLSSLDCYGAWITSKQARKCCNSGQCSRANPDPCCKNAPSDAQQSFVAQQQIHVHPPLVTLGVLSPCAGPLQSTMLVHRFVMGSDIPPPLEFRSNSLPLLI